MHTALFKNLCDIMKNPENEGFNVGPISDKSYESDGPGGDREDEVSMEIPLEIYSHLPAFLNHVLKPFPDKQKRDIVLLSTLAVFSGCLPKIFGLYAGKRYNMNFFLIIVGPAGSGKSNALWARTLVKRIECAIREEDRVLFLPADMSSAALLGLLKKNDERGIIIASEIDTLAQNFKKEWGDVSPLLRAAFEHEAYDSMRKGDKEHPILQLARPEISMLMTGTPSQVSTFIPTTESGLFSRTCMYYNDLEPKWHEVFPRTAESRDSLLSTEEQLGPCIDEAKLVWDAYMSQENSEIPFTLTESQRISFHNRFTELSTKYGSRSEVDALATIHRQGLITFRIAGILTALRNYHRNPADLTCSDEDLQTAFILCDIFIANAFSIAELLEKTTVHVRYDSKMKLYDALPNAFNYSEALAVGVKLGIDNTKTVQKYLKKLQPKYITHLGYDKYVKNSK